MMMCKSMSFIGALASETVCGCAVAQSVPSAAPDWAKEQRFWSFRKFAPQPRPTLKNAKWPRVPVDYFVAAAMERKGLFLAVVAVRCSFCLFFFLLLLLFCCV